MKTADKLLSFRRLCERQTGRPISEVEVPLLYVFHDLCQLFGIPKTAQERVLGRQGMKCLRDYQQSSVSTNEPTRAQSRTNNHRATH